MSTGILIGIALTLIVEYFIWGARKAWRMYLPTATPQPPATPAQLANQAAYEYAERNTPRVFSMSVQRRTARGRRRLMLEREPRDFEN